MQNIRHLQKDEIQCRPSTVKKYGFSLLLYKDARCDMAILDETVGPFNWQRRHDRDNANCTVSIWDSSKGQWIHKEDTGVESYTEKEKGLASDSFKRACFNWGIGRELYTAPFIWIKPKDGELRQEGNTWKLSKKAYFEVSDINIEDHVITDLTIVDKSGDVRFEMNSDEKPKAKKVVEQPQPEEEPEPNKETKKPESTNSGDSESSNDAKDGVEATIEAFTDKTDLIEWWKGQMDSDEDGSFREQWQPTVFAKLEDLK